MSKKAHTNGEKKNLAKKETGINHLHKAVIDEYFCNGFNATAAAQTVKPELSYQQAANLGSMIINSDKNKTYIKERQATIGQAAGVKPYQIATELKHIAFNDVTQYIGLTLPEIKQLNPEQTRSIKKITLKEKQYRYKDGSEATEKTLLIEAHDKIKALIELGKLTGSYNLDNSQKATRINLTKLDINTLNTILKATTDNPQSTD